jgi:AraC family transcriptional regulator
MDSLLARHSSPLKGAIRGVLGKDVLGRIREYVMSHLEQAIDVASLASIAGRSPFYFTRMFARTVGITPHRYIVHLRLQRAIELIRNGQYGLAEVALYTGFADQSHLTRWMRRVHGVLTQLGTDNESQRVCQSAVHGESFGHGQIALEFDRVAHQYPKQIYRLSLAGP